VRCAKVYIVAEHQESSSSGHYFPFRVSCMNPQTERQGRTAGEWLVGELFLLFARTPSAAQPQSSATLAGSPENPVGVCLSELSRICAFSGTRIGPQSWKFWLLVLVQPPFGRRSAVHVDVPGKCTTAAILKLAGSTSRSHCNGPPAGLGCRLNSTHTILTVAGSLSGENPAYASWVACMFPLLRSLSFVETSWKRVQNITKDWKIMHWKSIVPKNP
jgi:hypothetical protein